MTETVQRGRERRFSVGVVEGVGVSCGASEQRFVRNLSFRAAEKESARAGGCPMTNASPGFRNFPETGAIFLPEGERPGRKQKKKVRRGSQKAVKGRTAQSLYGFRKKAGPVWSANGEENRTEVRGKKGKGAGRGGQSRRRGGGLRADGVVLFPWSGAVDCCGCDLCACCCGVPRVGNPLRQKKKADPEGSTLCSGDYFLIAN